MKYEVVITATAVWNIIVEADSKENAQEKVLDGEYDSKFDIPDDFLNEEIQEIKEMD